MKNKVLTIAGILAILLTIVGLTYAYFTAQAGGTTSVNATVTSNTTDLLTLTINQDISFTVTQAGFASGGQNQSGQAISTAILTPNNKTGAATEAKLQATNCRVNLGCNVNSNGSVSCGGVYNCTIGGNNSGCQ